MAGFELRVAPSAARPLERLPEPVAAAVVEFLTGPLLEAPRRVGKPLVRHLVVRIEHRADVYRPL